MSSVLFAHGHLLRFDAKQFAIGKPYPPLATITAAAHLRSLGHQVALYDPTLDEDTHGFAAALDRARPQVLVLYDDVFNWFTKMCLSRMREAALEMIRQARARGVRVVVSGHDAADAPQVYLAAGAEFVVVGEGEITMGELLARMSRGAAPAPGTGGSAAARIRYDDIPGLVFTDLGLQRRTGPRALLKELDSLAIAAWDLVDIPRYREFWLSHHGYFSLNVVTTRGCPYLCNWCAKPVYGNTYHIRSAAQVVEEIRLLRARYAPDHLWFCDDIFGLKKRWLMPFAEQIAAEGLVTPFLCQTRADLMTEDNVDALRRAGCAEAWLGVESGSQAILDAMDKGITLAQVQGAVSRLRAAKIRIGFFLQFGYPGEKWPEIEMTRRLVRDLAPDEIGISVSYPLPGTKFHDRVSGQLGEKRNWEQSNDLDPLFPGEFSRAFYHALSRTVHAEFRTRRALRAARTLARHPLATDVRRWRALGGLAELPVWLAGRARLRWARPGT
ncbi:MAG TPA: radical SAM protein [Polyangia bacterium]|jgi:anaerobic magnesium-protoporphyrin IX monomethyl ester cyclase|nr:radical SAM protein [Polyangia bacterium]